MLGTYLQEYRGARILLNPETEVPQTNQTIHSNPDTSDSNFDSKMVVILAALLCALISLLALNSIVGCAMRFRRRRLSASGTGDENLGSKGIKKQVLKGIPVFVYNKSAAAAAAAAKTDCPICLMEFSEGDKIRALPRCNHGFHVKCIDKWLRSHSSCPICRQLLFQLPTKINSDQVLPEV